LNSNEFDKLEMFVFFRTNSQLRESVKL
jgi:hypothetical protein